MKKIFILITVIAILTALTACGGTKTGGESGESLTQSDGQSKPESQTDDEAVVDTGVLSIRCPEGWHKMPDGSSNPQTLGIYKGPAGVQSSNDYTILHINYGGSSETMQGYKDYLREEIEGDIKEHNNIVINGLAFEGFSGTKERIGPARDKPPYEVMGLYALTGSDYMEIKIYFHDGVSFEDADIQTALKSIKVKK